MQFIFLVIVSIFVFLISGIFPQKAHAYLDPGTGSYIFQVTIAVVIGGLFAIKQFWTKIVLFLKNLGSRWGKNG